MEAAVGRQPLPAWFREITRPCVTDRRPGIYEWRIEGFGVYIGQFTRVSRPRLEYAAAVRRMTASPPLPYRRSNPNGFRAIHHALAKAVREGMTVTLTILENLDSKLDRNRRESELISKLRSEAAIGGLPVLNSTRTLSAAPL